MRTRLAVIYVPGLGDTRIYGQRLVTRTWRLWGVRAEVLQMHWADTEPWEDKLARLLARIDGLAAAGTKVALVGSSAGAAAVTNAYAQRKSQVVGCVLIAGKLNHPDTIGEAYRRVNPAFVTCAEACEKSLLTLDTHDRGHMLSRYALFDGVVPQKDSYIAGAHNQLVPTCGHAFTIGFQLVFGAPGFLRFLQLLARRQLKE